MKINDKQRELWEQWNEQTEKAGTIERVLCGIILCISTLLIAACVHAW